MLGEATSFWDQTWPPLISTAVGGVVVLMATGVVKLARDKTAHRADDIADFRDLVIFLFGRKANPRTGTPGDDGWVAVVNARFDAQDEKLDRIIGELVVNGGENARGSMDRAAAASEKVASSLEDP